MCGDVMSDVALVIPFGALEDDPRSVAVEYVIQRYEELHPTLPIYLGNDDTGAPWSKGRAVADGVAQCSAPILVIADGDVIVQPEALGHSIVAVMHGAAWSQPHGKVYRLSRRASDVVYQRRVELTGEAPNPRWLERPVHDGPNGGGMVVLTRTAYEATGGIDPRFVGFGGDDISWARALNTLVGPCERFDYPMTHLWHERTKRRPGNRGSEQNEWLAARYGEADGDEAAMRALIKEFA